MKILSVDTSSKTCSACFYDGNNYNELILNENKTHSETLLPLIEELKEKYSFDLSDMDYFAVNVGPGSFTGIRIGISTIKGIATVLNKPCVATSTLESMAYNFDLTEDKTILSLIDARNNRFFYSIFKIQNGIVERTTDDDVDSKDIILNKINDFNNVYLVGDGAKAFIKDLDNSNVILSNEDEIIQKASSVAKLAINKITNNETCDSNTLMPVYLRPSQAEREKIEREQKK